jgi:hypothetical protein
MLAREAALAACINVLLALAITWLRYGSYSSVPVWGLSGLVADAVPSTVLPVTLMSVALTLVVRRRQRALVALGLPQATFRSRLRQLPEGLIARALALAALALAVVLPVTALMFSASGAQHVSLAGAMTVRLLQACLLGVVCGPVIVVRTLCEPATR